MAGLNRISDADIAEASAAFRVTDAPSTTRVVTLNERLHYAGVPVRFQACRLDGYRVPPGSAKALAAAQGLATPGEAGTVLSGGPGTGKTHLAVGILAARLMGWLEAYPEAIREVARPGPDGLPVTAWAGRPPLELRFMVVPTFLDRLRAVIRYADRDDPLPALFDVDLLVLDDLGREKVTDWASERLYVLVNERYNRRRPTIVTTNYSPDELASRGYDALISRLVEGAAVVLLTAADYRSGVGR